MNSQQALRWLPVARALTLQRPWADAILHCGKRVENRTWAPPASVDALLIHAGKATDPDAEAAIAGLGIAPPADPATSAIVALAQLAWVCDSSAWGAKCDCGPWAARGQYHWHLADDLYVLPRPVPARGMQGLWRPTPAVLAELEAVITGE